MSCLPDLIRNEVPLSAAPFNDRMIPREKRRVLISVSVFEGEHFVFGDEIARESVTLLLAGDKDPTDAVRAAIDSAKWTLER